VKCVGKFVRILEEQWCWKVFLSLSPNFIWPLKGQTQGGEGSVIAGLPWPWYSEVYHYFQCSAKWGCANDFASRMILLPS
jgi:hypothetical protein